jgi:hypothetical protein
MERRGRRVTLSSKIAPQPGPNRASGLRANITRAANTERRIGSVIAQSPMIAARCGTRRTMTAFIERVGGSPPRKVRAARRGRQRVNPETVGRVGSRARPALSFLAQGVQPIWRAARGQGRVRPAVRVQLRGPRERLSLGKCSCAATKRTKSAISSRARHRKSDATALLAAVALTRAPGSVAATAATSATHTPRPKLARRP